MAAVGCPAYFAQHGQPRTPHDLARHSCINLRMVSGSIYAWEFEKDRRELKVKVEGQLKFNDVELRPHLGQSEAHCSVPKAAVGKATGF
jgi:hypothetical protein